MRVILPLAALALLAACSSSDSESAFNSTPAPALAHADTTSDTESNVAH